MLSEYPCAMQRRNICRRRVGNRCQYIVAISIAFQLYTSVLAAPASYDSLLPQSSEIAEYFSDISGCYYNFQRYEEGDRIVTNEPCLNCTCHNRMLMCYLRVCPFTKAIGQDCTIEKKPDQCCPIITCPEVPVRLLTSSTTSSPTPAIQTTEIGFHDNYGCSIHDSFYADGAQVPPDPKKPCELCYCIRNRTACVMQECTLHVEGCKPVYQDGICCPVRYDCDYEKVVTSTTRLQTSEGVIKSTTYATVVDCQYGNQSYSDGELITTDKPCEHCYCMRGDIVCAVQDCGEPLRGKDCVPTTPPPERCCPSSYDCTNDAQTTENITKVFGTSETELPPRFSVSDKIAENDTTTKSNPPPVTLSREEIIYQKLGENNISTPARTSHFEKVENDASTRPAVPSQHPSETIESDNNSFDSIERFTTSARPSGSHSSPGSAYEIIESVSTTTPPKKSVPAATVVEFADTQRPGTTADQHNVTKFQIGESEFSPDESTTSYTKESNLSTITDENVKFTSNVYSDRTSSPVRMSTNTTAYPKVPETATKFVSKDDIDVVSKVKDTELLLDSPTTPGEIVSIEKGTTDKVYETITNAYPVTTFENVSHYGAVSSSTDRTSAGHTSEHNGYSFTTPSIDKMTIVDENDVTSYFSSATKAEDRVTEKINSATEWQNEKVTENINTVSDKNTEPLNDQLAEKEQENTMTVLPAKAVTSQYTTIRYPPEAATEKKPESVAEKTSISTAHTAAESEKEAATVGTFVGVPGEGNCLVDGITYRNTSIIESSNPCHFECLCLSSIPTCTLVKCNPAPNDPKCMPIQVKPDSCCPIYVCGGDESSPSVQTISSDNHVALADSLYLTEEKLSTPFPFLPILSERNSTDYAKFNEKNRPSSTFLPNAADSISGIDKVKLTSSSSPLHSEVTTEATVHETMPPASPEQNDIIDSDDDDDSGSEVSPTINSNPIESAVNTDVPLNRNKGSSTTANAEHSIDQTTTAAPHLSGIPLEDETGTSSHNNESQHPGGAVSNESALSAGESTSTTLTQNNEIKSPSSVGSEKETIGVTESTFVENNEILQDISGVAISNEMFSTSSEFSLTTKDEVSESDSSTPRNDFSSSAPVDDEPAAAGQNVPSSSSQVTPETTDQSNKIVDTTLPPNRDITFSQNHAITVEQNYDILITTRPNVAEYESGVTTAAFVSSSTLSNDNQAHNPSLFITTIKPDVENEITEGETNNGSTNEQNDGGEVKYTTSSSFDETSRRSTLSSSIITTSTTPALIKSTERGSTYQTEVDEIISSTAPLLPSETYLPDSGTGVNAEISKPLSPGEDTTVSQSSMTSSLPPTDQSNDISSAELNEHSHKFGATDSSTNYVLASEYSHSDETTSLQQQSITTTPFAVENVDTSSISSQQSSASEESVESVAQTLPPTVPVPEHVVETTKVPENSDVTQSEIVVSDAPQYTHSVSSITSENPNIYSSLSTMSSSSPTDTKFPNGSEKGATESAALPETLSESNFTPIQHSTWTRKPMEEEVTSEASYYPNAPMYPPSIENGGNFEGLGMEYDDENSGAFGPGTCRYAGKVYVSAQQIPRDDPCDFCFCFRSDIICLQQSCPPPIHGCRQEPIQGFCCPRYECPVAGYPPSNATTTTSTATTTTTTIPSKSALRFPLESYRGSVRKMGCVIHGYFYNVGDDIAIASGPCLECVCGSDGRMKCDPKSCSPEPYARQMVVKSAFSR